MATITNTHITVESGSQPTKAKVTVKSEVNFAQTDSGAWKIGIKLFGDDTAEAGGTPLIYTFKFGPGNVPLLKRDYLTVQATPGTMKINESREIDWEVLDEDPGETKPANAPPGTPGLPLKDEVFAAVTLSRESKSNIWTSAFGL